MPSSGGRRPFKFQEFVGHSGDVRCISIGRKSCQVLATGGDDRKVNVWALGKPNALLSLSGHTSPVQSVTFDAQEEVVVAGATSGTIKLWDLDQAKTIRTLVGHRSDCLSVDFHPYGAFFASGSLDTNLKVWDIRRKACIQTYKGHVQGVSRIRFSPDGKWVVSGGEDGFVKLWDLTAGKLLYEYQHDGEVTSLDFHPSELLLSSGSTDRTVRLLDLEALQMVCKTPAEGSGAGVSAAFFSGDGDTLMSVSGEYMKVWAYDPQVALLDVVETGWGGLGDVCVNASAQAVACTLNQSFVQVWALNLSSLQPWTSGESAEAPGEQGGTTSGSNTGGQVEKVTKEIPRPEESTPIKDREEQANMRKQFVAAQKRAEEERIAAERATRAREVGGGNTSRAVNDKENSMVQGTDAEGGATNSWGEGDAKKAAAVKSDATSGVKGDVAAEGRRVEGRDATRALQERLSSLQQMWGGMQEDKAVRPARARGWGEGVTSSPKEGVGQDNVEPLDAPADVEQDACEKEEREREEEAAFATQSGRMSMRRNLEQGGGGAARPPASDAAWAPEGSSKHDSTSRAAAVPHPSCPDEALPLSAEPDTHANMERLTHTRAPPSRPPRSSDQAAKGSQRPHVQQPLDEGAALDDMLRESATVQKSLRSRLSNVRDFLFMWQKGDVAGALQAMVMCSDDGAVCDVLSFVSKQPHVFTLDAFVMLLPRLTLMLESDTDEYALTSMHTLQILLRTFSELIQHTRAAVLPPGVDISAEERRSKCDMVYTSLQTCSAGGGLAGLRKRPGKVGLTARGVTAAIETML